VLEHDLYYDVSCKRHAVLPALLLSCKLLSAPAVGVQGLYVQTVAVPKYQHLGTGLSQN
jgi:hypothetical protein